MKVLHLVTKETTLTKKMILVPDKITSVEQAVGYHKDNYDPSDILACETTELGQDVLFPATRLDDHPDKLYGFIMRLGREPREGNPVITIQQINFNDDCTFSVMSGNILVGVGNHNQTLHEQIPTTEQLWNLHNTGFSVDHKQLAYELETNAHNIAKSMARIVLNDTAWKIVYLKDKKFVLPQNGVCLSLLHVDGSPIPLTGDAAHRAKTLLTYTPEDSQIIAGWYMDMSGNVIMVDIKDQIYDYNSLIGK